MRKWHFGGAPSSIRLLLPVVLLSIVMLSSCGTAAVPRPRQVSVSSSATPVHQFTYVAIGASDAFGIGTADPDRQAWPSVLARSLGTQTHLVNLGIPGETVAAALQDELPIALDSHPDVVTIWLAVNDIADHVPITQYEASLAMLLSSLKQHTQARVFVANIPDLTVLPYFASQNPATLEATIQQWNAVIASVTARYRDILVNLAGYSAQLKQHPDYIASDGLHPSTLGAKELAGVFALTIKKSGI